MQPRENHYSHCQLRQVSWGRVVFPLRDKLLKTLDTVDHHSLSEALKLNGSEILPHHGFLLTYLIANNVVQNCLYVVLLAVYPRATYLVRFYSQSELMTFPIASDMDIAFFTLMKQRLAYIVPIGN